MKTTKILLGALRVSALVALFAIVSAPAQAQVVNVQISNNSGFYSSGEYASSYGVLNGTFSGVGAASDPGTVWNNVVPGPYGRPIYTSNVATYGEPAQTLDNSTGTATTVTFELSTVGRGLYGQSVAASFGSPLLSEWSNPGNFAVTAEAPATLTIGGLADGAKYNLYLYAQNGGLNDGVVTFTFGSSQTVTNTGSDTTGFVNGGNYVEFTNLIASGSGVISGTYYNGGGDSAEGINGFQIQEVAAAPEPASLATMGLGGMALLLFLKRFKKQSV